MAFVFRENQSGKELAFDSLMQVSFVATKSLDLDKVLPDTLARVADVLDVERLTVLQLEEHRVAVRAVWASETARSGMQPMRYFPRERFPSLRPLHFAGTETHLSPFQAGRELPYLACREAVSVLRVPLVAENILLGRLDVLREGRNRTFTQAERRFTEACAKILGLALRNGTEYARVAWLAEHDPLTGLGNRRRFDGSLDRELARAERYGRDLSLLLLDLDDFKEVNSRLGLSAGDEVLRRTARVLGDGARHGVDVSCRIGGDEFAMLLPEVNEASAGELAQRLLRDVEAVTRPLWPVRFSYSIVSYPGTSAEQLRRLADSRLLHAKTQKTRTAVSAPAVQ